MRIIFHISTNCNLRCTYCYQHDKDSPVLSFDDAKLLIDKLFAYKFGEDENIFKYYVIDSASIDVIKFEFFGGECTLYIELMEQICDYFLQKCDEAKLQQWRDNFTISVETNGTTFLRPKVYNFYKKYGDRLEIPMSIDGCKECHDACRKYADGRGSYDDVEKAILAHKRLFGVTPASPKLTFSKQNMSFIKDSLENLFNLGYSSANSSFDVFSALSAKQSELYYENLKKAIDWLIDNKIYFEWEMLHLSFKSDYTPGMIKLSDCGTTGEFITIN